MSGSVVGAEGLDMMGLRAELSRGARLVRFSYTISVLVMTFRRETDVHLIRPGENAILKGLPYTLLSLFVGWWGIPWGPIYTTQALAKNLSGGYRMTVGDYLRERQNA